MQGLDDGNSVSDGGGGVGLGSVLPGLLLREDLLLEACRVKGGAAGNGVDDVVCEQGPPRKVIVLKPVWPTTCSRSR